MTVWYHATAYYGDKMRHWWNRSRDELATDVVVPFVSKQIHLLKRNGIHSFFNFGMAEYITVVKTSYRLRMIDGKAPRQLSDSTFVAQNSATDEFLSEMKRSSGGSARSIVEQALTPPDNKAFVVMKFSDAVLNSAYKRVYRPVCLACG